MATDKLHSLQKESAGLHCVPSCREVGMVPWWPFSGAPAAERAACPCLSAALSSPAIFVFPCMLPTWKHSVLFPALLLWPVVRPNSKKDFQAFTWNANDAQWYLIAWHLARSIQKQVSPLREQRPAQGVGGALGCKASASWVCSWVCAWQPSQGRQCHLGDRAQKTAR